jgi:hypothetical protein
MTSSNLVPTTTDATTTDTTHSNSNSNVIINKVVHAIYSSTRRRCESSGSAVAAVFSNILVSAGSKKRGKESPVYEE